MKKLMVLILSFLLVLTLGSCGRNNYQKYLLKEASEKITISYKDIDKQQLEGFLDKIDSFAAQLSAKIYKDSVGNYTISPISIYMALAMAIESSNGSTREEMLNAVGVTYEEVVNFTSVLYSYSNMEYKADSIFGREMVTSFSKLANSIWIDDNIQLKESGLESLASKYHADSYYVPFKRDNKAANKAFSDYFYQMTNGLIDSDLNLSVETIFTLVNTYYLKELWNEDGDELSFTSEKYSFINYDNSIIDMCLLQGYYNNGKAYEEETFTHFFTKTEKNYRINFILPKDGYTIDEVFTAENIKKINNIESYLELDDERMEANHTRCLFPEFTGKYNRNIKDILIEDFGISSLFTDNCDFSNLTDGDVYCDGVIHQCSLTVNKKGIDGAAITVMPMAGAAGPGEYTDVYYDYVIDRAFGFTITDGYGITVFSGVIKSL